MAVDTNESLIRKFRSRLHFFCFLRRFLLLAAAWLFLSGTVALVLRIVSPLPGDGLLAAVSGMLIPLLVLAGLWERARLPSPSAVRAIVDARNRCGGLLMAAAETPIDPAWTARLPALDLPRVGWHGLRHAVLASVALLFAAFTLFVPIPAAVRPVASPLEIRQTVQELQSRVDQLEDKAAIESNKAVELREELAKLESGSSGTDPVKAWEALDHIKDMTSDAAKETLEKSVASMQNITKAQSLAEMAMALETNAASSELRADTLRELGDLVKSQDLAAWLGGANIPRDLLDAAALGQLTPEQLKMLSNLLKDGNLDLQNKLVDLSNLKWVQGDFKLAPDGQGGDCTNALLALLAAGSGDSGQDPSSGLPGKGGIDRGRGDAPLTWSDGTAEAGAAFKAQALPSSAAAQIKENVRVGVSVAAPAVSGRKETTTPGALTVGPDGVTAHGQAVLPRHRGAVRRFFDRQEKKKE